MFNNVKKISGFTLIEMVVVIAVIGVLMTIAFRGTAAIQGSARDVKRVKALNDMRAFLEQYYTQNGSYPNHDTDCVPSNAQGSPNRWSDLATDLANAGIVDAASDIANDPTKAHQYCYVSNASSNSTDYRISAVMERARPSDNVSTNVGSGTACNATASSKTYCQKP